MTIIYQRDLFAVVILASFYGLVSASFFVVMDAVDVAFTEAVVGAGISTVLMLATLGITGGRERVVETVSYTHLTLPTTSRV